MDRLKDLLKNEESQCQLILVHPQELHQFGIDLIDDYLRRQKDEVKGENLVSQVNASKQLCVTSSTLWRWSQKGLLHPVRIGGKVLFKQSELDKVKEA
jgi:hypothetical protein